MFNIIKRRHLEDEVIKKYPVLKENAEKREPIENMIKKISDRIRIPK